jgi:hypothetical protein
MSGASSKKTSKVTISEVDKFIELCRQKVQLSGNTVNGTYLLPEHRESIVQYLECMPDSRFKSLVSDPYWNKYPEYSYSRSSSNKKRYGHIIRNVIYDLKEVSERKLLIMNRYSEGIWLKGCLHLADPLEQRRLANRGIKSKDQRVRKLSVEHIQLSSLKNYVDEPNSSVRWAVKKRMLAEKVDLNYLDSSKDSYFQRAVIKSIKLSPEDIRSRIDKIRDFILEQRSNGSSRNIWHEGEMLCLLASKLSPIDAAFYLNLPSELDYGILEKVLSRKIRSSV